jgi:hypothetical protein
MSLERFGGQEPEPKPSVNPEKFYVPNPDIHLDPEGYADTMASVQKELTHDYRTGKPITPEQSEELQNRLSVYGESNYFKPYYQEDFMGDPRVKALSRLREYVWTRSSAIWAEAEQAELASALKANVSDRNRREAHDKAAELLAHLRPDLFKSSREAVEYIKHTLGDIVDKDTARTKR